MKEINLKRIKILQNTGILFFVISISLFLFPDCFAQEAFRYLNSSSTININNIVDEANINVSTYITFHKDFDCSTDIINIFSIKQDTLDGMLYILLPSGELYQWFEIKNGLLWNAYVNNDSLISYQVKNGNGYIDYNYTQDQNTIIFSSMPTERIYYCNGYPYRVEWFNKDGTFLCFYNVFQMKKNFHKFSFQSVCAPFYENNDSLIFDSIMFYNLIHMPDFDTLFYIGDDYIVTGYEINNEGYPLLPYDYYIPSCYSNKKRERYLKKLKRYLIPIYEKHGKFTDEYSILFNRYTKKHIKQLHIQRDVTP